MIKTIAETAADRIFAMERNERGFYPAEAEDLVASLRREALEVRFPHGKDSCDPTVFIIFKDGSGLSVGNPDQIYYSMSIVEYDRAEDFYKPINLHEL